MGDVTASLDCQTWNGTKVANPTFGVESGQDALQPNVAESLHNKA